MYKTHARRTTRQVLQQLPSHQVSCISADLSASGVLISIRFEPKSEVKRSEARKAKSEANQKRSETNRKRKQSEKQNDGSAKRLTKPASSAGADPRFLGGPGNLQKSTFVWQCPPSPLTDLPRDPTTPQQAPGNPRGHPRDPPGTQGTTPRIPAAPGDLQGPPKEPSRTSPSLQDPLDIQSWWHPQSIYVYAYVYMYMSVYVNTYIYIYIYICILCFII